MGTSRTCAGYAAGVQRASGELDGNRSGLGLEWWSSQGIRYEKVGIEWGFCRLFRAPLGF